MAEEYRTQRTRTKPLLRRLENTLRRHPWRCVALFMLVVFIPSVIAISLSQVRTNPSFTPAEAVIEAVRIALVYVVGEYEGTRLGGLARAASIILLLVGIVAVAVVIGKVASSFVNLRMEVKMPDEPECHIIICNWNERGDRVVKELHASSAAQETEIIIITEKEINEEELRASPAYEKVYFVRSDPTLHEVLRRARAHLARSVIILADSECSDPDAKTALISLAITKLEENLRRTPHIVAEVISHQKIQHLLNAGVDEWVCSTEFGLGILAQCALAGKLSEVYQQLLRYSKDTNEIYLVDCAHYPESLLGSSFEEVARILNEGRDPGNPTILLGIKRDDHPILNPRAGEFDTLRAGDALIVMAFDQPDLTQLTVG